MQVAVGGLTAHDVQVPSWPEEVHHVPDDHGREEVRPGLYEDSGPRVLRAVLMNHRSVFAVKINEKLDSSILNVPSLDQHRTEILQELDNSKE